MVCGGDGGPQGEGQYNSKSRARAVEKVEARPRQRKREGKEECRDAAGRRQAGGWNWDLTVEPSVSSRSFALSLWL